MTEFTSQFNFVLGLGTLIGQVILVGLLLLYFTKKENFLTKFISHHALRLTVLITGAGTFLSLFYSEVLHILPCNLCWYQRIFIYSTFLIGVMALWRKENRILDYIAMLMTLCLIIGVYHYYIQWGGVSLVPCDSAALVSPCADKTVLVFNYITIPLMSVTSSIGVLLIYLFYRRFDPLYKK